MSTRYLRSADWTYRKVFEGKEGVLVPLIRNTADLSAMLMLNETAIFIWECLEQSVTANELAARVGDEFEIDPAKSAEDVAAFLKELVELGAVSAN